MEEFGDIPDGRMTIESEQRTVEHRRLMKQLEARAQRPCKKLSLSLFQLD